MKIRKFIKDQMEGAANVDGIGNPFEAQPQHTPGPWNLHPRIKPEIPVVYKDGCIIATVDTSAPEPGEREANARLIASAPELLDMVKNLHGALGAHRFRDCKGCQLIAKAEGK